MTPDALNRTPPPGRGRTGDRASPRRRRRCAIGQVLLRARYPVCVLRAHQAARRVPVGLERARRSLDGARRRSPAGRRDRCRRRAASGAPSRRPRGRGSPRRRPSSGRRRAVRRRCSRTAHPSPRGRGRRGQRRGTPSARARADQESLHPLLAQRGDLCGQVGVRRLDLLPETHARWRDARPAGSAVHGPPRCATTGTRHPPPAVRPTGPTGPLAPGPRSGGKGHAGAPPGSGPGRDSLRSSRRARERRSARPARRGGDTPAGPARRRRTPEHARTTAPPGGRAGPPEPPRVRSAAAPRPPGRTRPGDGPQMHNAARAARIACEACVLCDAVRRAHPPVTGCSASARAGGNARSGVPTGALPC